MDSFTESLLSRARERQKLLEGYDTKNTGKVSSSEPNLSRDSPKKNQSIKTISEGNIPRVSHQGSTTLVSSEITSSPKSQKTLNIQKENFNMEIKVSSADNVRVEVQIEEVDSGGDGSDDGGLREDAKKRLNRLGKLYAGGEDAEISSPIHQTEARFHLQNEEPRVEGVKSKRGLSKLADLAQNFNDFEDDLSTVRKDKQDKPIKKSWKPPAPQPPTPKTPLANKSSFKSSSKSPVKPSSKSPVKPSSKSPLKASSKSKAPNPPTTPLKESPTKKTISAKVQWDQNVLNSLESQGFTRTESSSRLVYSYNSNPTVKTALMSKIKNNKENAIEEEPVEEQKPINSPQRNIPRALATVADKTALFESSPNKHKDPALLSVSERKALFEKNKGVALVPKAAFAMPVPVKSKEETDEKKKEKLPRNLKKIENNEDRATVPQGKGIANMVASLFQNKNTIAQQQIENNIKSQRQKDMDLLLNRFHKTPENVVEYEEEQDDDHDDATEETAMIDEKSVKIVASSSKEKRRSSGNKRCTKSDSPKVTAVLDDVKRIKVSETKSGRLYPSLTDIESVTETDNETQPSTSHQNSSFDESTDEDANTSFGRDILQAVCKHHSPNKRNLNESTGSELSDVLDDMDDYIDEALAFNGVVTAGPTPPKHFRQSPIEPSHSFKYKNFQTDDNAGFRSPIKVNTPLRKNDNLPTHVIDGENILPLTHTVSFYRKQQNQPAITPVRQVSRVVEEICELSEQNDTIEIETKQVELKTEISKQEMIISQTSQALNLCNSTPEFFGSTEQVEAERVLLVATHRRQAALHELQRLEVEKTLRPQRNQENLPLEKGTLVISKIVLPLKQKYVTALAAAGGKGHHVICLVKYANQVQPTTLVSTVATNSKNPELELKVPGTLRLQDVYSDFTVTFEVYCLQAQEEILPHEVKYHIKKPNVKLTPKKGKGDSRLTRPIKESPAGPQAVRSPTFALMGYVVFSIQAVNKKHWSLNNAPPMSPLEGIVEMKVSCELSLSVEHRGFLTMFEDVSGFGAWHRRWCLLKGDTLNYWKYPDDEKKTPPINSINLKSCFTKNVGPVSREICARLHTFLVETERLAHPDDKDSLIMICKGNKTVIRHLLSADTKEERISWCTKFNSALAAIHVWS